MRGLSFTVFTVGMLLLGCSAGTGPVGSTGGRSGVPSNETVSALSQSEKATLCDWATDKEGGYGKVTACDGGLTLHNKSSQADCVASFNVGGTCSVTVGQLEDCILAISTADPCSLPSLSEPKCTPFLQCARTKSTTDAG